MPKKRDLTVADEESLLRPENILIPVKGREISGAFTGYAAPGKLSGSRAKR